MLRVTKLTDYASVVLTVLASEPDAVLSATGLAERAGLEPPTVAKVLKPLAQAGLVEAFRGASGGYRLARMPADISLIEIVEAMEGPLGMTECSVHAGACGIERSCSARANVDAEPRATNRSKIMRTAFASASLITSLRSFTS